jgi:hypothetical protein
VIQPPVAAPAILANAVMTYELAASCRLRAHKGQVQGQVRDVDPLAVLAERQAWGNSKPHGHGVALATFGPMPPKSPSLAITINTGQTQDLAGCDQRHSAFAISAEHRRSGCAARD